MSPFISLEGPDGSGKSTQARLLGEALRARGHAVTELREPGGTPVGEQIRSLLLDADSPPASPLTTALLLSASRAQLVSDIISPALKAGQIVISDRFADSTLAYQSFGSGLDSETVRQLESIATQGLRPDQTILIDVPTIVGLRRIAERGKLNRIDSATVAFHERVREGFLRLSEQEPGRWVYIDGSGKEEEVRERVLAAVVPLLEKAASPS